MRAVTAISAALLLLYPQHAASETCESSGYPVTIPDDHEHARWIDVDNLEPDDVLFEFGGFTAVFDGPDDDDDDPSTEDLLQQPEWAAHEVKRYVENGMFVYANGLKRPRPWYELSLFSDVASVVGVTDIELDDSYSGEGTIWNRGHLATRSLVNRLSARAGCNTHNFANAVPHYWSLNQGEWVALERYVGALANQYGRAWQISGPIFFPDLQIETIGGQGEAPIPIPHALFKVIVFHVDDEIFVRAFMFHQPAYATVKAIMATNGNKKPLMGFRLCESTDQDDYDFGPHVSSLQQIQDLTGIRFFPEVTDAEWRELNGFSSRGIWRVDRRFFERPCGGG